MYYDEIAKKLGIKLKYYRNLNNMTQENLAVLLNSDVRYISDVERGKRNITLKTICKLSKVLNVNIHSLFNFEE